MEKREVTTNKNEGMDIKDILLVAVLLAAGVVLKIFIPPVAGMKPNFIIAMYALSILLIRPRLGEALVIGILAGGVCQLLPGTPYINFISEILGALTMALLIKLPIKIGKISLMPIVATFVSTVVSGGTFTLCLLTFAGGVKSALAAYVPIVLCTAALNAIIVSALNLPLSRVLKKS